MNKNLVLSILLFINFYETYAQFGTIGYDFKDSYVEFKGLKFAIRLSTDNNIYCPNPEQLKIKKLSENEVVLISNSLSSAGGQLVSEGSIELKVSLGSDERITILAQASHPSELGKTILILIKGIYVNFMVSEQPQAKEYRDSKTRRAFVSVIPHEPPLCL